MSLILGLHRVVSADANPQAVHLTRLLVGTAATIKSAIVLPHLLRTADPGRLRMPHGFELPYLPAWGYIALVAIWLGAAAAFAAGKRVRISGAVLVGVMAYTFALDRQLYSNHWLLIITLCAWLTLAGSGPRIPYWPVFLAQTQLATVYLFAGLTKLNLHWISGAGLASHLRWGGLLGIPEAFRVIEFLMPMAVITAVLEVMLAVGLWVPRWRRGAAVMGIGMHVFMVATVPWSLTLEIFAFALASIGTYPLFFAEPRVPAPQQTGKMPMPRTERERSVLAPGSQS